MFQSTYSRRLILLLGVMISLAGCNLPRTGQPTAPVLGVTQAYRTVQARLTQAVVPTLSGTSIPEPTDSGVATATEIVQVKATLTPAATAITPSPTVACDLAAPGNPIDVTIPDDTEMRPGQPFTKTWRLQNIGTCTWTREYQVELFSGEKMGAPASTSLSEQVPPGQGVDISVDMVAPQEAGTYQGNWKLRNAAKVWFGIGPNGNSPFWVRIVVVPLPTTTPTPPTPTPTATSTPVIQTSGTVTMTLEDKLDLDSKLINNQNGEDLAYENSNDGKLLLVPEGSAQIGVYGTNQPQLSECQSAAMRAVPLVLDNLAQGTYLCYRTNLGLPGWALLLNLNPETITLEILTWSLP